MGLPDWTITLVLVFLLVGFPVTLVLAWAFDLTPEGVGYWVVPPWFSMQVWNRQYTYKNSSSFPWRLSAKRMFEP